ncbi:MAG TPA: DegQ family serine endoprotease [Cellvibrionaceae bacterium]|nr:DegQ family serine endoprotease [Cellvibrionaceae bacterium]HNG59912.1 DegQ family serine endoprotease [Cellvibrionaceae bacterium]
MKLPRALFALAASLFLSTEVHAVFPNTDSQGDTLPSLAPMLEKVNPAVVNIATYSTRENNPLLNDPNFRRFFNIPDNAQRQPKQQAAGSGVIIDAGAGTVVTNFHVIKGADEIQVILTDGRNFKAKLLGSDPEADIAVLKIDAKNIAAAPLANSDKLRVGDFVVAIGNPFGLGQTVTTGIVSALGRSGLGIEGYEDFIQTDASINPGNSGGALVNLRGELIGINTAILAPTGGNVGIGFAIPVNMAKSSIDQILKHGEVKRGQLGVSIQDITPDLQTAFDLKNGQKGVLITGVAEGSEAEKAGLQPGDLVTSIDGKEVASAAALRNQIGIRSVGDKIKLQLLREGKEKELAVVVGKSQGLEAKSSGMHQLLSGIKFEKNPAGRGLIITKIAPNAPAAQSGLEPGDVIVSANRQAVDSVKQLEQAIGRDSEKILLQINREGGSFFVVIR